jgi:cystathionine beta-lyase/cystathionine gamma-synthase
MPQFSASLSVDQGFNFRKDVNTPVGFIKALKVNGKDLAADIVVKDPMNPTTDVLEKRLAELERGIAALGLASGQAAITYSLMTIMQAGHNFVTSTTLYGGTYNLFASPTTATRSPSNGSSTRTRARSTASRSAIRPATSRISRRSRRSPTATASR